MDKNHNGRLAISPNTQAGRRDIKVLQELTKRVNIRITHPNMYRVMMIVAIMFVALAINLYLTKPTFAPYGLRTGIIASVFLLLGISKIIFLNFYRNLKLVRLTMAISTAFMLFWGVSNTQQAFAGKASFQLPILYITLAILNFFLLLEPVINPLTANGNGGKK